MSRTALAASVANPEPQNRLVSDHLISGSGHSTGNQSPTGPTIEPVIFSTTAYGP